MAKTRSTLAPFWAPHVCFSFFAILRSHDRVSRLLFFRINLPVGYLPRKLAQGPLFPPLVTPPLPSFISGRQVPRPDSEWGIFLWDSPVGSVFFFYTIPFLQPSGASDGLSVFFFDLYPGPTRQLRPRACARTGGVHAPFFLLYPCSTTLITYVRRLRRFP